MTQLSVIIITKNEAHQIRRCLQSVAFADEIIVLDSGSTDDTAAICREFTRHVTVTDWPGFGPQKNRALQQATGQWVLSIDADEWVTDALREQILQAIKTPTHVAYEIPRQTLYLHQIVKHGDVGRDKVLRLFKRESAKFSEDIVHEKVCLTGGVGQLSAPLMHDSYPSVEGLMQRMNDYTSLSAAMRFQQGKKTTFAKAVFGGIWAFLKSYVFRAGFLDGRLGFIVAVTSAESSYYRHLKLLYWDASCKNQEI